MGKVYDMALCAVLIGLLTACNATKQQDISLSPGRDNAELSQPASQTVQVTEATMPASTEADTEMTTPVYTESQESSADSSTEIPTQMQTNPITEAKTESTTPVPTQEKTQPTGESTTPSPTQPPTEPPTEPSKPVISAEMEAKVADSMNAYENYIQQVFYLVNERRKASGLSELQYDATLCQVATYRCIEIIETDTFSHTRPDGTPCYTLFNQYGMVYSAAGENLAAGQMNPEEVVTDWMNSLGHRANILGDFTNIGIGVAVDKSGCLYWAQSFTKSRK